MIVRLGETKTGTRRQVDEHVERHLPTILIAQVILDLSHDKNGLLWPYSQRDFRDQFRRLCQ